MRKPPAPAPSPGPRATLSALTARSAGNAAWRPRCGGRTSRQGRTQGVDFCVDQSGTRTAWNIGAMLARRRSLFRNPHRRARPAKVSASSTSSLPSSARRNGAQRPSWAGSRRATAEGNLSFHLAYRTSSIALRFRQRPWSPAPERCATDAGQQQADYCQTPAPELWYPHAMTTKVADDIRPKAVMTPDEQKRCDALPSERPHDGSNLGAGGRPACLWLRLVHALAHACCLP
jgi:hypothetical protein